MLDMFLQLYNILYNSLMRVITGMLLIRRQMVTKESFTITELYYSKTLFDIKRF